MLPTTEARVAAVEAASGRATMLALQDASVHVPLGMYLHSRWVPLSHGPRALLTGSACAVNLLCPCCRSHRLSSQALGRYLHLQWVPLLVHHAWQAVHKLLKGKLAACPLRHIWFPRKNGILRVVHQRLSEYV